MNDPRNLMDLSGRKALITGAAGGLGKVFAETLALLGADLILVDLDHANLKTLKSRITAKNDVNVEVFECDLEDEIAKSILVTSVTKSGGELNILINNAAFVGSADLSGWSEPFELQSIETWRRALEVNLTSCFQLIQGFLPLMKKSKGASVINIASIYGLYAPDWRLYEGTSMSNPAAYAASKGGLIQFTRWLAATLGPDIRVNSISPGGILRDQPEIFIERYEQKVPLRRMAKEEDLIGAISYLASDLSSYVTGINLEVDGGWGI